MNDEQPIWIRGPELRVRWGSAGKPMSNSTFYDRLARGTIPAPEFPFGPDIPHWRVSTILEFEARAALQPQPTAPKRKPRSTPTAAAPVEPPPKRGPGRPRKSTGTLVFFKQPPARPTPATPPKRVRRAAPTEVSS